jgi:heme/copper-type cytochrome/quinol oxidase subunit 4
MKRYVLVWLGLLAIVALEVILTIAHLRTGILLAGLLALAGIEAALGLMYFMHLRYERRSFALSLILAVLITVVLMDQFWFDAFRLLRQRLSAP